MYYIVETEKTFEEAVTDLKENVVNNQFGVLHIHDLGYTLRSKGTDFTEECCVFEVCNPSYASKVLKIDLKINMALPCRISVYTENGIVKIGAIKPLPMLTMLSNDDKLVKIAGDVEKSIIEIIDRTK